MKLIMSCMLLVVVFLSGCAVVPPVLSERVAQYSLGEIKFIYSEDVVAIWEESGVALFEATAREDIKIKLAAELTGEQPLHLYVDIQRVFMTRKGAQIALFLFVQFNDLINTTVWMLPGEAGVAASAARTPQFKALIKDALKEKAEGRGPGINYIMFQVSTGDPIFSGWDSRIKNLAEAVAKRVVHGVKYE